MKRGRRLELLVPDGDRALRVVAWLIANVPAPKCTCRGAAREGVVAHRDTCPRWVWVRLAGVLEVKGVRPYASVGVALQGLENRL